ncbi:MAG: class E sortase [Pseudonocardiaceae bacterium]
MQEQPVQGVAPPRPPVADAVPGRSAELRLVTQVLGIVAVLTLSFLLELTVLGTLRHGRDQAQLGSEFRSELANQIAPVGPLDEANQPLAAGTPVALLEIPSLNLREVVVEGTSSGTLMSGPGHRRDTPFPGQVGTSVIAGRRATYGAPFRSIGQLRAGDRVMVATGQGKNSFVVLGVRHEGDPVPPALTRGQSRLTLVTADGPPLRPRDALRVDADLLSAAQPLPALLPSLALPAADVVLAGDSSALLGVVEWVVSLVAAAMAVVWVRFRVGWWRAWVMGVPVLVVLGLAASDAIAALLPNLL